jgi:N-acetyl-anhydromuramoyl-L-alanine amidase
MNIKHHRLSSALYMASPNCDARPDVDDIRLLVIHCISLPPEQFGGDYIDQLFCNELDPEIHPFFREIAGLRVSAHVLIRRDGRCHQYVPFDRRAWHAGVSQYQGRDKCNDFSIGIELEGSPQQLYTDVQYRVLATITQLLLEHYPRLSREAIVGHSDIAPGRKTDPGAYFDWCYFFSLIDDCQSSVLNDFAQVV